MCPGPSDLIQLLDDELPPLDAIRLRRHLDCCEVCRQKFRDLNATWQTLGAWKVPPAPAGFTGRVLAAASAPAAREAPWRRALGFAAAAALAAAIGIAAALLVPRSVPQVAAQSPPDRDELAHLVGLDTWDDAGALFPLFTDEDEGSDQEPL